jgi:hypothetical protein
MKDSSAEYVLAFSRVILARMLNGIGRPDDAASLGRAAVEVFERRYPDDPKRAEAACEVGRAQVLERLTAEGRAALELCLPIYRA